MSLFQSSAVLFYVILFLLSMCSFAFAAPKEITEVTSASKDISCNRYIMPALLLLADMDDMDVGQKKTRVKRDGKFKDAASMGMMKVAQFLFAMVTNLYSNDPIGGKHPMSRNVPGSAMKLLKESIVDKLSPKLSPDD